MKVYAAMPLGHVIKQVMCVVIPQGVAVCCKVCPQEVKTVTVTPVLVLNNSARIMEFSSTVLALRLVGFPEAMLVAICGWNGRLFFLEALPGQ